MAVNKKSGHFTSFSCGFPKSLLRPDVELPREAENDRVEHFRHVKINELFSTVGLASQALYELQVITKVICLCKNHNVITVPAD